MVLMVSLSGPADTLAQAKFQVTKSFQNKLQKFGLEYLEPVENWLHPIPYKGDKFADYDMVFVSEDDSLEVRYIFQDLENPMSASQVPHIEFVRMLSTLATNNQESAIAVRGISDSDLLFKFGAHWGYEADFVPKRSVSQKQKAKAIAIFNPYKGLVFSLLFYNNIHPPAFFDLPIRFKD